MSTHCRSCGAEIRWVHMTSTGARMPLDPKPEKRVVLYAENPITGDPVPEALREGAVVDTYLSHFATCPNADQHRRRR